MTIEDLDNEALAQAAARELATMGAIIFTLRPVSALQLAALVQLVLRHPNVPPETRNTGIGFLAGVRRYFAEAPAVLELLRRGDDPAYDDLPQSASRPS
jgi:hypothetical protein